MFTVLSFLLTLLYLDTVRGKLHRIPGSIAAYDWTAISSQKLRKCVNRLMCGFTVLFIMVPFVTLLAWGGIILRQRLDAYDSALENNQEPLITPIAIFTVGFAAMFFLLGVLNTKWKKYRLTRCSICLTVLGLFLLILFQIIAVFLDRDISYFGVSTIFLASNATFLILIVFLNSDTGGRSIQDLIQELPVSKEEQLQQIEERQDEDVSAHSASDLQGAPGRAKTPQNLVDRINFVRHGPKVVDQPIRDRWRDMPFD